MDVKVIALVCIVIICCCIVGYVAWNSMKKSAAVTVPPPTPSPVTMAPQMTTEPPLLTTAPPHTVRPDTMLYAPGAQWGYWGGGYPGLPPRYTRLAWPEKPRPIQPGGTWSELMGKDKDDATAYIMSTYPNMHVALVRYGAAMPEDYRTDRFIIVYDTYTRKVVGAQIG